MGNFKIIKHVKEVYSLDKKYLGDLPMENPDRELYGYSGRRQETIKEDTRTNKGKLLKKGVTVSTEMQMICGRVIINEN